MQGYLYLLDRSPPDDVPIQSPVTNLLTKQSLELLHSPSPSQHEHKHKHHHRGTMNSTSSSNKMAPRQSSVSSNQSLSQQNPITPVADEHFETVTGEHYLYRYFQLDVHQGMKFRREQPSLLKSDESDDEESADDVSQPPLSAAHDDSSTNNDVSDLDLDDFSQQFSSRSSFNTNTNNNNNNAMKKLKDHWKYLFGGDVSCIRVESKPSIKLITHEKQSNTSMNVNKRVSFSSSSPSSSPSDIDNQSTNVVKKIYPIQVLIRLDDDSTDEKGNAISDNLKKQSWITMAAESKLECNKWVSTIRQSRDVTQYFRACRDCSNAAPLSCVVSACRTGDWRTLSFKNQLVTNSSICALAVFLRRQPEGSNKVSERTSGNGYYTQPRSLLS